jgi:hypothetical protein
MQRQDEDFADLAKLGFPKKCEGVGLSPFLASFSA